MEANTRLETLVQSAEEVRRLLKPALIQLQEREKFTVGSVRTQLMETSGVLAEVVGSLYMASRAEQDEELNAAVGTAYAKLEALQKSMAQLQETEGERHHVAQALALLFALGIGPRSSCPPPRRSSTSMRAVRIPEAPRKTKTAISSPSIELGEIEAAALGIDLDGPPSSRRSPRVVDDALMFAAEGSERRTSPRIGFEVDVGFVSESHFYAGLSMDVSDGGLFVATYQLQPIGSEVVVTFVLPSGYAVTTNAVVRWVREQSEDASPGMGLAFELTGEDKRQVRAFCDRRRPLFIDMD